VTEALQRPGSALSQRFAQLGEYSLPDGSIAQLYRHDRAR
jgi:hypothetical protein